MAEFIRSTVDHPLLTELTASYAELEREHELLTAAIRARNQARSEMVPAPADNAAAADRERFRERSRAYYEAAIQERCAASSTANAVFEFYCKLAHLIERVEKPESAQRFGYKTKDHNKLFSGYLEIVARQNIIAGVETYQRVLAALARVRVVELTSDERSDLVGRYWMSTYYLQQIPVIWRRDDTRKSEADYFDLFAMLAAKIAENRQGDFEVSTERFSASAVADILGAFGHLGWSITSVVREEDGVVVIKVGKWQRPQTA